MSFFERYFAALDGPDPHSSLELVAEDVEFSIQWARGTDRTSLSFRRQSSGERSWTRWSAYVLDYRFRLLSNFTYFLDDPVEGDEFLQKDVRQVLGEKVYTTMIPRNVRVAESPSHGKPVLLYDYRCSGSQAYIQLASEVIERERRMRAA